MVLTYRNLIKTLNILSKYEDNGLDTEMFKSFWFDSNEGVFSLRFPNDKDITIEDLHTLRNIGWLVDDADEDIEGYDEDLQNWDIEFNDSKNLPNETLLEIFNKYKRVFMFV